MSSFLPLEPERIRDMVGMLREFGTKSVKFAWSVPCFVSVSNSSGWNKKNRTDYFIMLLQKYIFFVSKTGKLF